MCGWQGKPEKDDRDPALVEKAAACLDMNSKDDEVAIGTGCSRQSSFCRPAPYRNNPMCRAWLGGRCPMGGVLRDWQPAPRPSGRYDGPSCVEIADMRWTVAIEPRDERSVEPRPDEVLPAIDRRWANVVEKPGQKGKTRLAVGESSWHSYERPGHPKRDAMVTRVV